MITEAIMAFFAAAQRGLLGARKLGLMGTPDRPIYYEAGDSVPWWAECRFPLDARTEFLRDCETYFEGGVQVIRPLYRGRGHLIVFEPKGGRGILVGAPTLLLLEPRPRRPVGQVKAVDRMPLDGPRLACARAFCPEAAAA